jgi:hypothetical protein
MRFTVHAEQRCGPVDFEVGTKAPPSWGCLEGAVHPHARDAAGSHFGFHSRANL